MLAYKTFPTHLPLHQQKCYVNRWPGPASPLLVTWDESNAAWQVVGNDSWMPWFCARSFAVAPVDAQPRTYPVVTNPYKWRRYPDHQPADQNEVWYHFLDGVHAPLHGIYVGSNQPEFGEDITGSPLPWFLILKWRPYE